MSALSRSRVLWVRTCLSLNSAFFRRTNLQSEFPPKYFLSFAWQKKFWSSFLLILWGEKGRNTENKTLKPYDKLCRFEFQVTVSKWPKKTYHNNVVYPCKCCHHCFWRTKQICIGLYCVYSEQEDKWNLLLILSSYSVLNDIHKLFVLCQFFKVMLCCRWQENKISQLTWYHDERTMSSSWGKFLEECI